MRKGRILGVRRFKKGGGDRIGKGRRKKEL